MPADFTQELDENAKAAFAALPAIAAKANRADAVEKLAPAIWQFVMPYWAALVIVERYIESSDFERLPAETMLANLREWERKADEILESARSADYLTHTQTAAPLRSLDLVNERIKDCAVALESMLDPNLDAIMDSALDEYRRNETVLVEAPE